MTGARLESVRYGPQIILTLVRLLTGARRDVSSQRHLMGAMVYRAFRQQTEGAAQHPEPYPQQSPLRGTEALEGRASETPASWRLQGHQLPVQADSRNVLSVEA